jgi:hypothetical protein
MAQDTLVAVFADHLAAEVAIRKLVGSHFDVKQLSIVGQGYHTDEQVVGFYNTGDRVRFWGKRGAFWGGLWGLFFGGMFMMVPVIGQVMVLGYLAAVVASAVEGAVVVGGLGALGAALYSIGVPKDSVLQFETDLKVARFLVTAHGSTDELAQARIILASANPTSLALHSGVPSGVMAVAA